MKKTPTLTTLALSLLLSTSALAGGADYAAPVPASTPTATSVQRYEPIVVPARPIAQERVQQAGQAQVNTPAVSSLDQLSGEQLLEVALKANGAEGLRGSRYRAATYILVETGELQDVGLETEAFFELSAPQTVTRTYQDGELIDTSFLTPDGAYSATPQGGVIPLPRTAANELWRAAISGQEGLAYANAYPDRVTVENGGQATWLEGESAVTGQVLRLNFGDPLGGGSSEMLLNDRGVIIAEAITLQEIGLVYAIYGNEGVANVDVAAFVLPNGAVFMAVKKLDSERNPTFAPETFSVPTE